MYKLLNRFDRLAGIKEQKNFASWLERCAFGSLILLTISAPHSIAATQTAWLLGMVFWVARYLVRPRPKFIKSILFVPLITFFGWTVLSSIFSYAPDISIDKLRGASLFLIFFFVLNNLRNLRSVRFLAVLLIISCMANVLWVPVERLIGRGIEIVQIEEVNPLDMQTGDVLLSIEGKPIKTADDIFNEVEKRGELRIWTQRGDFFWYQRIIKTALFQGNDAYEKLGIKDWKRSHNWRSSGFYGHYVTYAEVIQLIASLAFGLLIAGMRKTSTDNGSPLGVTDKTARGLMSSSADNSWSISLPRLILLLFITIMMALALLLTVTRASQVAFLISISLIVLLGSSFRTFFGLLIIAVPLIIVGSVVLQQSRNISFFDSQDGSLAWRKVVYREGFELWTESSRNFTFGVGMDSVRRYKEEWGLFDNGKLPPGHFHSTPLQLVVERGFPALLLWFWILGVYARTISKALSRRTISNWLDHGIVLGCLGGTLGFFVSGIVHYNLGDGEVIMIFYLLMAFSIKISSEYCSTQTT